MADVIHMDRSDQMPDATGDWVRITCNMQDNFVVTSRVVTPQGTRMETSCSMESLEDTLKRAIIIADGLDVSVVHVVRERES